MNIIFIVTIILLVPWLLGVLAVVYHVYAFRFPKDLALNFLIVYLFLSFGVMLYFLSWLLGRFLGV